MDLLPRILRLKEHNQESKDVLIAKNIITSYFNMTKKTLIDQLPKAIMAELVLKTKTQLQDILIKTIYSIKEIDILTVESEEIKEKRENLISKIKNLEEAYKVAMSFS